MGFRWRPRGLSCQPVDRSTVNRRDCRPPDRRRPLRRAHPVPIRPRRCRCRVRDPPARTPAPPKERTAFPVARRSGPAKTSGRTPMGRGRSSTWRYLLRPPEQLCSRSLISSRAAKASPRSGQSPFGLAQVPQQISNASCFPVWRVRSRRCKINRKHEASFSLFRQRERIGRHYNAIQNLATP